MSQLRPVGQQRRHLHFDALVALLRQGFERIPDPRRDPTFSLPDTLMAGLALFSLKDPSLLAFCRRCVVHNLRSVFGLQPDFHPVIDEVKNPVEQNQAGNHAVLLGAEQSGAARFGRDRRHGRQIAGADILVEGVADQSLDLGTDVDVHPQFLSA